jgi:hypothetical protein
MSNSLPRLACLLAGAALVVAGCGLEPGQQGYGAQAPTPPVAAPGNARFLIAWTIAGAAPTEALCARVAHLKLGMVFADGASGSIEPIPCNLNRLRYDGFPEGSLQFDLAAYDAAGCRLSRGGASARISATLPAAPSPVIDLPAPSGCGR